MSSSKAALVYSSSSCRKQTARSLRYQMLHMLKMIYYTTHTLQTHSSLDSMLHITPPLCEMISQRQHSVCLLYFMSEGCRAQHGGNFTGNVSHLCRYVEVMWTQPTSCSHSISLTFIKQNNSCKNHVHLSVQIRTFKAVSRQPCVKLHNWQWDFKWITFRRYISFKAIRGEKSTHIVWTTFVMV